MSHTEALKLAREILAPYRKGNHVSVGHKELVEAIADAIGKIRAES